MAQKDLYRLWTEYLQYGENHAPQIYEQLKFDVLKLKRQS
jgi:hypothetical protein